MNFRKEVCDMATSSIYTNVRIRKKSQCMKLVSALEHAKGKKAKTVNFSRPVEEVKGDKIKEFFK